MDNDTLAEVLTVAFRESFEDGLMVTGKDRARPGRVMVDCSISLPEGVVRAMLGDMYDGVAADRPPRSGRGASFELKGEQAEGDEGISFDDGSKFTDKIERPASPANDGEI